jgi:16S rRNA (cytosine967-C5)-methyltransferase
VEARIRERDAQPDLPGEPQGPAGSAERKESARGIALGVLVRVERDRAFADLALHAALQDTALPRADRALATELAYGTLRLRGRLDAALAQVVDRPLRTLELKLHNLLRLGAYQLLALRSVSAAAAVSQTVDLAREIGLERATGLINAVLRSLARLGPELRFPSLDTDPVGHLRDYGSLPEWLAERWVRELGPASAAALAVACTQPPPRTVRCSPGVDREALAARLGGRPCTFAPDGITDLRVDPARDPGFERGEHTVQDEASQLVPLLLGARPGDRVVDCCAAPGTKTVQLAQQVGPGGEVVALERHSARIPLIHRAARRLGLRNVRALERDATRSFDLQGAMFFRGILVDAPCSGLGTLRRNPDARWSLRAEDIPRCAERALGLLRSAARYVEPGTGALVYSVCTFTPEETADVVEQFLKLEPEFRRDDARPWLPASAHVLVDRMGALRTLPHVHGCDGFFAQRLVRA